MVGIIDLMGHVQAGFDKGRERGQQSYLGKLAGQAYGAAPDQQRGFVQQAIATNPDAGFSLAGALGKAQDRDFSQLGQAAAIFSSVPDDQKQAFYASKLVPLARQQGFQVPETYDPRFGPMIEKLAQQAGGMGTGGNVQSTYIDAQGNRVAIMRDGSQQVLGPNAPNNQIIDTGNGFFGVNKGNLQAAPVMVGGQQQQRAPGEVPFSIDPSLPPEVQAQIRANPDAGSAQGITSLPAAYGGQQGGGQQLTSVPKPSDTPDTFAPLSQDEVAQMGMPPGTVAQRNLKTGEVEILSKPSASADAKPMPVSALRLVRDSREKLSIAQGNIDSLTKIRDQVTGKDIELGPVANRVNQARNFAGMSTPESRNFGLMMSSLEKLRNDSLRLNNGVQTEGDAQRAWNELMANLNDEKVVEKQLDRIIEINRRAADLHQQNMDDVTANYGPGKQASPEQSGDIESLLEMYR